MSLLQPERGDAEGIEHGGPSQGHIAIQPPPKRRLIATHTEPEATAELDQGDKEGNMRCWSNGAVGEDMVTITQDRIDRVPVSEVVVAQSRLQVGQHGAENGEDDQCPASMSVLNQR